MFQVTEVKGHARTFTITFWQAGHEACDAEHADTFDEAMRAARKTLDENPDFERAYIKYSRTLLVERKGEPGGEPCSAP